MIWFSGGLVSVRTEVGLDDLEVSSNLDDSVILFLNSRDLEIGKHQKFLTVF